MEQHRIVDGERIEAKGVHSSQPQEETNNHSATLLFTKEWDNSDVIVVVNGNQEFHGHQSVLCLASCVFKEELSKNSTKRLEIETKIDLKTFELFLQFIYPQYSLNWSEYTLIHNFQTFLSYLSLTSYFCLTNFLYFCESFGVKFMNLCI